MDNRLTVTELKKSCLVGLGEVDTEGEMGDAHHRAAHHQQLD